MEYINVNGIYTNLEGTIDTDYVMYIKPQLRHVMITSCILNPDYVMLLPDYVMYMEYIKCARQYR